MADRPRVGIDFGSTEIKVLWMNRGCEVKLIETIPMPVTADGRRVTHEPEIVLERIKQIPDRLRFDQPWDASIASQRSTFVVWDRDTGEELSPLVSWRDRRGASYIDNLSEEQFDRIREITGLRPEAGYPLSKLVWLFDEQPELRDRADQGKLCYGSLDSWFLWKATGGEEFRMDPTQASRTLLYDVDAHEWSGEIMEAHEIPESIFPPIKQQIEQPIPVSEVWDQGHVVSLVGDQPASTVGGQRPPYEFTRVTLGTGGFVASPATPDSVPPGLTVTFAPSPEDPIYQAEGVVLSAGRALDWLQKVFGIQRETSNDFVQPPWPDEIPLFCPALNGVGAPFWSDRSAVMQNFSEDTSTRQIFTGLVVSILFRIRDILEELPESEPRVILDGGLTNHPAIPSMAGALWEVPISRALTPHLTARGALVVSHWEMPYFDVDPWDEVNLEVQLPESGLPVERWWNQWRKCLDDWGLEPVG